MAHLMAGPRQLIARLWPRRATPLGQQGERRARRHLKRHGYRIRATNLRTRLGEIDILAQAPDRRTLVLVEVKAGTGSDHPPEVHMTPGKQRQLTTLARELCRRPGVGERPMRFDVIIVHWTGARRPAIRHYVNAFEPKQ